MSNAAAHKIWSRPFGLRPKFRHTALHRLPREQPLAARCA